MANVILVDYDTAITDPSVKDTVIEAVVADPNLLITVLNANHTMSEQESKTNLQRIKFPFDTVLCNPLPPRVSNIAYKTMFAARLQESGEHTPVLVLDNDPEALQMWNDAKVVNTNG